jgi:hypothetical protein
MAEFSWWAWRSASVACAWRRSISPWATASSWCCWGRLVAASDGPRIIAGLERRQGQVRIGGRMHEPRRASAISRWSSELCALPAHVRRGQHRLSADPWGPGTRAATAVATVARLEVSPPRSRGAVWQRSGSPLLGQSSATRPHSDGRPLSTLTPARPACGEIRRPAHSGPPRCTRPRPGRGADMADRVCLIADGCGSTHRPRRSSTGQQSLRRHVRGQPADEHPCPRTDTDRRAWSRAWPFPGDRYEARVASVVRLAGARWNSRAGSGTLPAPVYVVEPMGDEVYVEVLIGDSRVTVRADRGWTAPLGARSECVDRQTPVDRGGRTAAGRRWADNQMQGAVMSNDDILSRH